METYFDYKLCSIEFQFSSAELIALFASSFLFGDFFPYFYLKKVNNNKVKLKCKFLSVESILQFRASEEKDCLELCVNKTSHTKFRTVFNICLYIVQSYFQSFEISYLLVFISSKARTFKDIFAHILHF